MLVRIKKVDMTLINELRCWDNADSAKRRIMTTSLSVSERSFSPKERIKGTRERGRDREREREREREGNEISSMRNRFVYRAF